MVIQGPNNYTDSVLNSLINFFKGKKKEKRCGKYWAIWMDIQESILEDKYDRKLFSAFHSINSEQFFMLVGFNLTTSYFCLIIITY